MQWLFSKDLALNSQNRLKTNTPPFIFHYDEVYLVILRIIVSVYFTSVAGTINESIIVIYRIFSIYIRQGNTALNIPSL